MSKQCFVITPIKDEGTPEFAHFRALFDSVIEPVVAPFGFNVFRADDVKRPGSVLKDVAETLASADLVIADLTGLNPNVLYELGVRHALCSHGTIMIMDDREHELPFDLRSYRVIRFSDTVAGLERLRRDLRACIEQLEAHRATAPKDNFVHDWLPLPSNVHKSSPRLQGGVVAKADSTSATKAQPSRALSGVFGESQSAVQSLQALQDALAEEKLGQVAQTLVSSAVAAAKRGDKREFIESALKALELRTSKPTPRHFTQLCQDAAELGLDTVKEALIQDATKMYPTSPDIKLMRFSLLARSNDGGIRAQVRQEMMETLGIRRTDSGYELTRTWADFDYLVMDEMLGAFHLDNLHNEALGLLTVLLEKHPSNPVIVTNYARALGKQGQSDESLSQYRKAMLLPGATDESAFWLGQQLCHRGRFVDATEAYLVACRLDVDDAGNFIHFADALSRCANAVGEADLRELPCTRAEAQKSIALAIQAAISIGNLTQENSDQWQSAADRAEVDIQSYGSITGDYQPSRGSRGERVAFVHERLKIFGSALSDPNQPFAFTSIAIDQAPPVPESRIHIHPAELVSANL